MKTQHRRVPLDQWETFGRFVVEGEKAGGKPFFAIDTQQMDEAAEKATQFVLRSNRISNLFEALEIYRSRGMVERYFINLKNWLGGDRLRVGANSMYGKVFVQALATALRMMMLFAAKKS